MSAPVTCHWAFLEALPAFGAIPAAERVVTDRNRVSGGGVTAGIDFGLVLLSRLLGDDLAQMTQLALEYDPEPPFAAGSPGTAGPQVVQQVLDWLVPMSGEMSAAFQHAAGAIASYTAPAI